MGTNQRLSMQLISKIFQIQLTCFCLLAANVKHFSRLGALTKKVFCTALQGLNVKSK